LEKKENHVGKSARGKRERRQHRRVQARMRSRGTKKKRLWRGKRGKKSGRDQANTLYEER